MKKAPFKRMVIPSSGSCFSPLPLLLVSTFLFLRTPHLTAQEDKVTFLPSPSDMLSPLFLDPNESQAYGAINAYWEKAGFQHKTYMPVGFGFYKGLIRWNGDRPLEIGFDASAHVQFEWDPNNSKGTRNILNSEYKISLLLYKMLSEKQVLRFRFYHISSHLGDDYLIQNKINSYFPNPNNYEQLDVLWHMRRQTLDYYFGAGAVVRPTSIRKRLVFQAGSYYDHPLREGKLPLGGVVGMDLKLLQEDAFNPRMKTGAGLRLGSYDKMPLRVVIEYYRGNLPYSPFEYKRVQWLGLGLYFSP